MSTENGALGALFVSGLVGTAGLEGLRGMTLKEGLGLESDLYKMLLGTELALGGMTLALFLIGVYRFRDARKKG